MTTMLASLDAAMDRAGMTAHRAAARPSTVCGASNLAQAMTVPRRIVQDRAEQDLDVRPDSQAAASNPRRMVAVTVALSEPADGSPLDWSETVASVLRLAFANTSVHVIDTWRNDVSDSRS